MSTNKNQGNKQSRKSQQQGQQQQLGDHDAQAAKRPRGAKYSPMEIDKLLDLIEERLPTGGEDWDGEKIFIVVRMFREILTSLILLPILTIE